MAAPLLRHRLSLSAQESVDDLAQLEQITEPAEIGGIVGSCAGIARRRRGIHLLYLPISPGGWNERAGAVRQDHQNKTHTTSTDAGDYCKRTAFERMTLARNNH